MFSAQMRMQAEPHLQFVNRLSRDSRRQNLAQSFEPVIIPLQPPHAFPDRKPGLHRLVYRTESRQWRQIFVRHVVYWDKIRPYETPDGSPRIFVPPDSLRFQSFCRNWIRSANSCGVIPDSNPSGISEILAPVSEPISVRKIERVFPSADFIVMLLALSPTMIP